MDDQTFFIRAIIAALFGGTVGLLIAILAAKTRNAFVAYRSRKRWATQTGISVEPMTEGELNWVNKRMLDLSWSQEQQGASLPDHVIASEMGRRGLRLLGWSSPERDASRLTDDVLLKEMKRRGLTGGDA